VPPGRPPRSNRSETLDASDVQELWVKFCRRQGGISAEQANFFRDLDRRAFQGLLTGGELKTAEKTLRLLKPTQDKAWFQDEREAEVHRSGCKIAGKFSKNGLPGRSRPCSSALKQ